MIDWWIDWLVIGGGYLLAAILLHLRLCCGWCLAASMSITLFRCWGLSRQMNEGCKACYKTSSKWRTSSPTEMIYVITMLYVSFEICSVAYTPWTVLHLIVCILQHGFYVYMTILTPQPPLSLLLSSQQFSTFCLLHLAGEGTTKITEAHQDQLLQLHWQFISSSVHTSIAIFHSRSSSSKLAIPDNKGTPPFKSKYQNTPKTH